MECYVNWVCTVAWRPTEMYLICYCIQMECYAYWVCTVAYVDLQRCDLLLYLDVKLRQLGVYCGMVAYKDVICYFIQMECYAILLGVYCSMPAYIDVIF